MVRIGPNNFINNLWILILWAGVFLLQICVLNLVRYLGRTWVRSVVNYESFSTCFHFFDKTSLAYFSNLCMSCSCSDDIESMKGISNPAPLPPPHTHTHARTHTHAHTYIHTHALLQLFWISSLAIHFHFHYFIVLNKEMHLLRHKPNSLSFLIFTRNCIPIMYQRRRFVFNTAMQNFS